MTEGLIRSARKEGFMQAWKRGLHEFGIPELAGQAATFTLSLLTGLLSIRNPEWVVLGGEQIAFHGASAWRKCSQEGWRDI